MCVITSLNTAFTICRLNHLMSRHVVSSGQFLSARHRDMSRRHSTTCPTCHMTCQEDTTRVASDDMSCLRHMQHSTTKLKYIKRSGWHAMAEPPDYVGDDDDDDVLEPIAITNDVLIELIKNTEQPEILNVRMIRDTNDTENEDNDGDDNSSNSSE